MEQPILVKHDDVPLHWHEAVAVVRSVADAVMEGRIRAVPVAGELALDGDGSLHVPAGAGSGELEPTQAVMALRELLRDLLPADAPAELKALADGRTPAPVSSLAAMRDAVKFFERPSSAGDRRALAARLQKVQDERRLEDEIERLKRKARAQEASLPDDSRRDVRTSAKKRSRRKVVLVAAFCVASGLLAMLILAPATARRAWSAGASMAADAGKSGLVGKLRDATRSALGNTAQPAPPEPSQAKAAPRLKRGPLRRSNASQGSRLSSGKRIDALPPASRLQLTSLSAVPFSVAAPAHAWKLPDDIARIFTGGDFDVAPPVLLRPHLPTVASVTLPRGQAGTVDVLVAEDGRVEQVRLVSTTPERAYYDAMILAAVKAWVFRPAAKGRQPVRYRLLIRLT